MKTETTQAKKELFLVDRRDGTLGVHSRSVVDADGIIQPVPRELKHYICSIPMKRDGNVTEVRMPFDEYLKQIKLAKANK